MRPDLPGVGTAQNAMRRLRVAGVRATGSGYPNAAQTIRLLRGCGVAEIIDVGCSLPDGVHLWRLREKGAIRKSGVLLQIVVANGLSLVRVLLARKDRQVPVYVPYPSVFFLWMLSWLPRTARPPCIADAYISIWDSMFRDRGDSASGWLSRMVKAIEGRALRTAHLVVVDTEANCITMTENFGLKAARVRAWPLAIDEAPFLGLPLHPLRPDGVIRVLFVGTLIPLHGVPALLGAIRLLAADPRFEFRIVGDGQLGQLVGDFIAQCPQAKLSWVREWQSLEQIKQEIAKADICLGVFGGAAKASRVLPFKLYMYLAAGKAVVTQAKLSTPDGVPCPPVESVPAGEHEIAAGILTLANSPALRRQRQAEARDYYLQWLGNVNLVERWRAILDAIAPASPDNPDARFRP